MYQPAVSAALKRLRELAGDPILVRSGAGMVPTDAGLRMIEPSASILRAAGMLFSDARGFDPATADTTFRLAASDYLDPLFLPQLVAQIKAQAPRCRIEIHPLSADSDYRAHLAQGEADIVIGNWLRRPTTCTWRACSATRWSAWSPRTTRPCAAAGTPPLAGGRAHRALAHPPGRQGRDRRAPGHAGPGAQHHGALPAFRPDAVHGGIELAGDDHRPPVLRAFCGLLPVKILPSPIEFPRMMYYQLWHERTHASNAAKLAARAGQVGGRHAAQGIARRAGRPARAVRQ
jgi:DNA-binding transcriptional LysR family regulator